MNANLTPPGLAPMRKRSASKSRIDFYLRLVRKTILAHQHPITGLLSSNYRENRHAWIRDNVYGILSAWALSMVYRKFADYDEDRQVAFELESSVCKLMRGLLRCMMAQSSKVEAFKYTQNARDSLHAKYDSATYQTVVGDSEWGHLQIDAVSLYVLTLAQLTASGLQVVYTLDEVDFVQNLVFYIESAYRIPDYGVWERGDKTNHGLPELNSSSIGIAKAALEAINELDLFGPRGSPSSVVHAMPDEVQQCRAVLLSMLPRESNSKELDSALLSVISYPAFAVDDADLIEETRNDILHKLLGRYGCKRFLRDGYKTPKEDVHRLHYEPWELKAFESIECEWPLFLTYLVIDAHFNKNEELAKRYSDMLDRVLVSENGLKLVPELFAVRREQMDAEKQQPGSQDRIAVGKLPHLWSQSLYIIGRLLSERLLAPEDLDPLNRRLCTERKPEVVVQVVILAESSVIQERIALQGVHVQTFSEVAPIRVYPSRVLGQFYRQLGKNAKLGLTGRTSSDVGVLATSKFYQIADDILAFTPQFLDPRAFYLTLDIDLMLEMLRNELVFLRKTWSMLGRPTLIIPVMSWMLPAQPPLSSKASSPLAAVLRKLMSGYYGGTRIQLGNLRDFVSTSCVTKLTFLADEGEREAIVRQMRTYADKGTRAKRLSGERGRKRVIAWRNMRFSIQRSTEGADGGGMKVSLERRPSEDISESGFTAPALADREASQALSVPSQYEKHEDAHEDEDTIGELNTPMIEEQRAIPRRRRISLYVREMLTGSRDASDPQKSASSSADSSVLTANPSTPALHHLKTLKDEVSAADLSVSAASTSISSMKYAYLHRSYLAIMNKYESIPITDVIEKLRSADSLGEQAELIHYLYLAKGLDFNTHLDVGSVSVCTVKDLIKELYERAGKLKQWSLVRHASGILKKRTDDFAKTVTDLLARQKQISVGMPPEPREKLIAAPLPPDELMDLIQVACDNDPSMMMLTQEIIVYLAMMIRTEPQLFGEMLRLRTGLIIQVMVSELEPSLNCNSQEATDYLLSMTPCDVKTLLRNLLSGKEIRLRAATATVFNDEDNEDEQTMTASIPQFTFTAETNLRLEGNAGQQLEESLRHERTGQWLRRRRIDGSLNRVPTGFYARVWTALEKGVSIVVAGQILSSAMTKEMTVNETKFALEVEKIMNRIMHPEYRQLVVEATMILCTILTSDTDPAFCTKKDPSGSEVQDGHVSNVQQGIQHFLQEHFFANGFAFVIDDCIRKAFAYYIEEQRMNKGDAMLCCASRPMNDLTGGFGDLTCRGANRICACFYDSAPSGIFGTMTYLTRSIGELITRGLGDDGIIDCQVM